MPSPPRVVVAAEHASARFGGEAILPLHYFRLLRARGVEAWLVVHARTRDELLEVVPEEDHHRLTFIPDKLMQRLLWRIGGRLPHRVRLLFVEFPCHFQTQLAQRRVVRRLVAEHGIDIVHEPIPVSPKVPSMMFGVGAPVVIGPMNGGMQFPPAFRKLQGRLERWLIGGARLLSGLVNRVCRGKRKAAMLLVANERTAAALPPGLPPPVEQVVENGVDLGVWAAAGPDTEAGADDGRVRLLFMGRMVAWKAVDLLLSALARVRAQGRDRVHLDLLGDGSERASLERRVDELGIREAVTFHGFRPQRECAQLLATSDMLVLPSLYECGGAVVLEAMAMGKPVIATGWGGPADYLDDSCGVLIAPDGPDSMVEQIAAAIVRLADDPALRREMGRRGREKVEQQYDWQVKIDHMLALYRRVIDGGA